MTKTTNGARRGEEERGRFSSRHDYHQRSVQQFRRGTARPYCPLITVAKTLVSLVSRYGLAPEEVDAILARVRDETVSPFFDSPWNSGPERIARLEAIGGSIGRQTAVLTAE